MASTIYTPSGSSQQTAALGTEKVRISTTSSAIAVTVGSNPTANLTACEIIPANTVNNSFIVGEGNKIAYIAVSGTGIFSVTELGAPIGE
jgi:precorrin isomerase